MPTTTEIVFYPAGSSTQGYQDNMATMASSIDTALGIRAFKTYRRSIVSDLAAIASPNVGDECYIASGPDSKPTIYKYFTSWQLWNKPLAGFSTTVSGASVSVATLSWVVSSGIASIYGSLNPVNSVTSDVSFTLPTGGDINALLPNGQSLPGTPLFIDTGGLSYPGIAIRNTATSVYLRAINSAGTYAAQAGLTNLIPFTWAAGDYISVAFSYPVA